MKILKARVDWDLSSSMDPKLEILVDEIPSYADIQYEAKKTDEGTFYYGELSGLVNFMIHVPRDEHGYGGAHYTLSMKNGTIAQFNGPWSSRAGIANSLGFPACIEVRITADEDEYHTGRMYQSAHVLVSLVKEAINRLLPGLLLQEEIHFEEEPYYVPTPDPRLFGTTKENRKRIGSVFFPYNLGKEIEVHIFEGQELQDLKDSTAIEAFGSTKAEAHDDQICISCKLSVINRIHTDLGWKEYGISGLCEDCWDDMFKEGGD